MNKTLMIIKPDAIARQDMGYILDRVKRAGFIVRAAQIKHLTEQEAKRFYEVHAARPFYMDLVRFMTSGPCMPAHLERENAVLAFRELIGATDPSKAAVGTIRKDVAESLERNSVHGSDSDENAAREIEFFFGKS